jgi:hypothetical protein
MLTELDESRKIDNLILMTTSNFEGSLDAAFTSRVDVHYRVPGLSEAAIYKILADMLEELRRGGILKDEGFSLLTFRQLSSNDPLLKLCHLLKEANVSGRQLRRLPFQVLAEYAMRNVGAATKISMSDFIDKTINRVSRNMQPVKLCSA